MLLQFVVYEKHLHNVNECQKCVKSDIIQIVRKITQVFLMKSDASA